jgi:hypothetical protein
MVHELEFDRHCRVLGFLGIIFDREIGREGVDV